MISRPDAPHALEDQLAMRILVLDGAIGTLLQQRGFSGNFDRLSITCPDVVGGVHREYLESGSDIIGTNTFTSTDYEVNVRASRLAREACDEWSARTPDRPRFVAGVIGPAHPARACAEQARGLTDGGCDLLLLETIMDPADAMTAVGLINEASERRGRPLPLMLSATLSTAGRTASGHTVEAFWRLVAGASPLIVGLNCSVGAPAIRPYLETLARIAGCYVSCHPSAGLPNVAGAYDERPADTAFVLGDFASRGLLNVAGGCCGTTPGHISAIAEAVRGCSPRTRGPATNSVQLH